MKRLYLYFAFLFCAITIFAVRGGTDEDREQLRKFNQFYSLLSAYYIDDLDSEPLVESAIRSVLKELDPHSAYFNADEMKAITENFEGEFSGIGIEFSVIDDTLRVVNTIVGAPAEKVGVMANDRIIRIDTLNAVGITQSEVPKRLRGERGSRVDIDVLRGGERDTLHFSILRDNIPINTIDAHYKLNPTTGYIRVNRFGDNTMTEFYEAFESFGKVENIVLDLRGNGGGLLSQAVEMANFFLPRGVVIVSTEGVESKVIKSPQSGRFQNGKVIVMIDGSSASASEIVAGALQDWDRGVIVGQTSFGKGLVQRQFPLSDGSAVRITISKYLTPSGRAIQRPYTKGQRDEYYAHPDTRAEHADSLQFKTLRLGREVYGGGGITPDIEILGDTTSLSPLYAQLIRRGVVNNYTINYLDKNREELKRQYPTFESFRENFQVNPQMIESMVDSAREQGVDLNDELNQDELNQDTLSIDSLFEESNIYIKALIVQRLFSTSSFYEIINRNDSLRFSKIDNLIENWDSEIIKIW